jgi:hypothetical protein
LKSKKDMKIGYNITIKDGKQVIRRVEFEKPNSPVLEFICALLCLLIPLLFLIILGGEIK